jgi:hypothetical protein
VSKRRTGARRADQGTIDALMWLRDHELVPWHWIVDERRTVTDWPYAATVADYMRDRLDEATINPWGTTPPLLLVESRSLGGVLRNLAGRYSVAIAPTNGQVGGFLRTDIAPLLPRPVLYLGDHDLSGDQIEAKTRRVLGTRSGRGAELAARCDHRRAG